MRYLVAALWISASLLACDDRDPVVGPVNNGEQPVEEDEQPVEEDGQPVEENEQPVEEDEQPAGEESPRTEEGDRAKLTKLRQEIDTVIGDAEGASIGDCRSAAIGAKPCGGPWAYIVYSASATDPVELAGRLAEYNALEAEMNALYGYFSDCSRPSMPVLVFVNGRCGAD